MEIGMDVMWPQLELWFGMEMGLVVIWPELKLLFRNGDGIRCDVASAETLVWDWRWDWM